MKMKKYLAAVLSVVVLTGFSVVTYAQKGKGTRLPSFGGMTVVGQASARSTSGRRATHITVMPSRKSAHYRTAEVRSMAEHLSTIDHLLVEKDRRIAEQNKQIAVLRTAKASLASQLADQQVASARALVDRDKAVSEVANLTAKLEKAEATKEEAVIQARRGSGLALVCAFAIGGVAGYLLARRSMRAAAHKPQLKAG
jgi:hypothetical protein